MAARKPSALWVAVSAKHPAISQIATDFTYKWPLLAFLKPLVASEGVSWSFSDAERPGGWGGVRGSTGRSTLLAE